MLHMIEALSWILSIEEKEEGGRGRRGRERKKREGWKKGGRKEGRN